MTILALTLSAAVLAAEPAALGRVELDATCSEKAKPAFLRGLAALHSFWYEEARASFQEAVAADGACHIARWGLAMTHNQPVWGSQDFGAGREALAGIPADAKLSPLERGLVTAARALFGEGEKPARDRAWAAAMEKVHADFPAEPEAAAFRALSLLATSGPIMGPRGPGNPENDARRAKAGELALELFKRKPEHPGAAHYAIHAYDDPPHAALALDAARRYAKIAPASSHALHMPAHIFVQLGMWPEAAASNLAAWEASLSGAHAGHGGRHDLHSLEWLVYSRLQLGQAAEAKKTVDATFAKAAGGAPPFVRALAVKLAAQYVVETGKWDEAKPLLEAPVEELLKGPLKDFELSAVSAGLLALGLAEPARAAALAKRLADARPSLSMPPMAPPMVEAETSRLMLAARGAAEPWPLLDEAAALEARQGLVAGPPAPIKPVSELYGELLLAAGRKKEAAERFARELERHPNRTLSVRGLEAAKKS